MDIGQRSGNPEALYRYVQPRKVIKAGGVALAVHQLPQLSKAALAHCTKRGVDYC